MLSKYGPPEQAHRGRRVRDQHVRSVRILSGAGHADHGAWHVADQDHLADRALGSEEELAARFRVDHGHLRLPVHVVRAERPSGGHRDAGTLKKLALTPLTVALASAVRWRT